MVDQVGGRLDTNAADLTGAGDTERHRHLANQLTIRAVDPLSKMPEFKVAAVHVEKAAVQPA